MQGLAGLFGGFCFGFILLVVFCVCVWLAGLFFILMLYRTCIEVQQIINPKLRHLEEKM